MNAHFRPHLQTGSEPEIASRRVARGAAALVWAGVAGAAITFVAALGLLASVLGLVPVVAIALYGLGFAGMIFVTARGRIAGPLVWIVRLLAPLPGVALVCWALIMLGF